LEIVRAFLSYIEYLEDTWVWRLWCSCIFMGSSVNNPSNKYPFHVYRLCFGSFLIKICRCYCGRINNRYTCTSLYITLWTINYFNLHSSLLLFRDKCLLFYFIDPSRENRCNFLEYNHRCRHTCICLEEIRKPFRLLHRR